MRGKQYLLRVLDAVGGGAPSTRGIGTHARVGDKVLADELGTKFWMRVVSVHYLPDDDDEGDAEIDESFDDCDQDLLSARGPSWVTDDILRYSQPDTVDTTIAARSPNPERVPSRHGILSTVTAVEAIGPAVMYLANVEEGERRQSWDSSWMPDAEMLRSGQRQSAVDDSSARKKEHEGYQNPTECDGGGDVSVRARNGARERREKELSAIEDPAIHDIFPTPNFSTTSVSTSTQHGLRPCTASGRSLDLRSDINVPSPRGPHTTTKFKVDASANAEFGSYPSPHPPSPGMVRLSTSNKNKPLPVRPTARNKHDEPLVDTTKLPESPSLLNVDPSGSQSYPTPSSRHLRTSPAGQPRGPHRSPRLDGRSSNQNPGYSDVMRKGEMADKRLEPQGLGISFSEL